MEALRNERAKLLERCAEVEADLASSKVETKSVQRDLDASLADAKMARTELESTKEVLRRTTEERDTAATAADNEKAIHDMETEFNAKIKALADELSAARKALASTEARSAVAEDNSDKLNQEVLKTRGQSIIVANKLKDVMEALEGVRLELEDEKDRSAALAEENEALKRKLETASTHGPATRRASRSSANGNGTAVASEAGHSDDESDGDEHFATTNAFNGDHDDDTVWGDDALPETSGTRKTSVIEEFIRPVASDDETDVPTNGAHRSGGSGTAVTGSNGSSAPGPKLSGSRRRRSLLDGMIASATIPELEEEEEEEEESSDEEEEEDNATENGDEDSGSLGQKKKKENNNNNNKNADTADEKDNITSVDDASAELVAMKAVIFQRDLDIQRLENTIAALKPIQVEINALKNIIDTVGEPADVDANPSQNGGGGAAGSNSISTDQQPASKSPRDQLIANPPKVSPVLVRKLSVSAATMSLTAASSPTSASGRKRNASTPGMRMPVVRSQVAIPQQTIQDITQDEEVVFKSMLRSGWLMGNIRDEDALNSLVKRASVMHFAEGQRVIEKDFIGGGVLAVCSGKLSLQDGSGGVAAVTRQGDLLGESSISLDDMDDDDSDESDDDVQQQPFNIIADVPSSVYVLTVMDIESGLKLFPKVRADLSARTRAAAKERAQASGAAATGNRRDKLTNYISRGSSQYIWSSNNQVNDATATSIEKIVGLQENVIRLAGHRVKAFQGALHKWQERCHELRVTTTGQLSGFSKESASWAEKMRALEERNEAMVARIAVLTSELDAAKANASLFETLQEEQRRGEEDQKLFDENEERQVNIRSGSISVKPSDGPSSMLPLDEDRAGGGGPADQPVARKGSESPSPSLAPSENLVFESEQPPLFTPAVTTLPSTISSQLNTLERRCEVLEARVLQPAPYHPQMYQSSSGAATLAPPSMHKTSALGTASRPSAVRSVYVPGDHSISKLLQLKDLLHEVRSIPKNPGTGMNGGGMTSSSSAAAAHLASSTSVAGDAMTASMPRDALKERALGSDVESLVQRDRLVDKLESIKIEMLNVL